MRSWLSSFCCVSCSGGFRTDRASGGDYVVGMLRWILDTEIGGWALRYWIRDVSFVIAAFISGLAVSLLAIHVIEPVMRVVVTGLLGSS